MKKKIIVISEWKNVVDFQQLKANVENNISNVESFTYLFFVQNSKVISELPKVSSVSYISKRDFTLFGKIKTPGLIEVLNKENEGVLIVAMDSPNGLLKKVLKHSKLMSIGMERESLPNFDLSFSDSQLEGGKFFKQINNYLTKIQL